MDPLGLMLVHLGGLLYGPLALALKSFPETDLPNRGRCLRMVCNQDIRPRIVQSPDAYTCQAPVFQGFSGPRVEECGTRAFSNARSCLESQWLVLMGYTFHDVYGLLQDISGSLFWATWRSRWVHLAGGARP